MRYLYKRGFLDGFDSLSHKDQALVRAAEKQIRAYHETSQAPIGLRIKKLHRRGKESVYEARLSISLRIIWAQKDDLAAFVLVGTHDEVRRFLKRLT